MKLKLTDNLEEFYLAGKKKNTFLVYNSDFYKFSEIDILLLLKICLIEKRSKKIGKKILEFYKDLTKEREDLTLERLQKIGIKEKIENEKPIKFRQ